MKKALTCNSQILLNMSRIVCQARKILCFFFLMLWIHPVFPQDDSGFSMRIESDEQVGELLIQAISQQLTRYTYSETERRSKNDVLFIDVDVEDTFSIVLLPPQAERLVYRYVQGAAMWERLFIVEEVLPDHWDELKWPELILSQEPGDEGWTLENDPEVRSFLEQRFEDVETKMSQIDSLEKLVFTVSMLKNMLKDDRSLATWLTRPLQSLGHNKTIHIPVSGDTVLFTQVMIHEEELDTLRVNYQVVRSRETENQIRYTQVENHDGLGALLQMLTGSSSFSGENRSSGKEEWVLEDSQQLVEYIQHHETSFKGGNMVYNIEKHVVIKQVD